MASEQEIRAFVATYMAENSGRTPTVKGTIAAVGGPQTLVSAVIHELRSSEEFSLRKHLSDLSTSRAGLQKAELEVLELLQVEVMTLKAEQAKSLFEEAKALAEEAQAEARAETRLRVQAALAKAEAIIAGLQPELTRTRASVDRLEAEYAKMEARYGRRTSVPGLQSEITDARRGWHAVTREIKLIEKNLQELRAELARLDRPSGEAVEQSVEVTDDDTSKKKGTQNGNGNATAAD